MKLVRTTNEFQRFFIGDGRESNVHFTDMLVVFAWHKVDRSYNQQLIEESHKLFFKVDQKGFSLTSTYVGGGNCLTISMT